MKKLLLIAIVFTGCIDNNIDEYRKRIIAQDSMRRVYDLKARGSAFRVGYAYGYNKALETFNKNIPFTMELFDYQVKKDSINYIENFK